MKYFKDYANHKLMVCMKRFGFKSPVLEIGCGTGETLEEVSKKYGVKGVDLSNEAIEACRKKGLNAKRIDAFSLTNENRLNSIICMDILEHVDRDYALVKHMYELLEPGGKLYVQVPSGKMMKDDVAYGHYRRYSRESIVALLQRGNFSILHTEMIGYPVLYYTRLFMNVFGKIRSDSEDRRKATLKSSYDNPFDKSVFAKILCIRWIAILASRFMLIQNVFAKGGKGTEVIVVAEKKS
jgi:SAM-dependent methyltransferase